MHAYMYVSPEPLHCFHCKILILAWRDCYQGQKLTPTFYKQLLTISSLFQISFVQGKCILEKGISFKMYCLLNDALLKIMLTQMVRFFILKGSQDLFADL